MHDPMTAAFEIRSPIRKPSKWCPDGYREPLVTIWHRDPERHGDDDSCGWSYVRLTDTDRQWAEKQAEREWKFWFSPEFAILNFVNAGNVEVVAAAWSEARLYETGRHRSEPLSAWDMGQVIGLLSLAGDNFGCLIRDARRGEEGLESLLALTLRSYRTRRRPWYRHPKWHVHHWRVQVHGVQRFKRWAFSRCAKCGGRFAWGYSPVSNQWGGGGPKWFGGEPGVYHKDCYPNAKRVAE